MLLLDGADIHIFSLLSPTVSIDVRGTPERRGVVGSFFAGAVTTLSLASVFYVAASISRKKAAFSELVGSRPRSHVSAFVGSACCMDQRQQRDRTPHLGHRRIFPVYLAWFVDFKRRLSALVALSHFALPRRVHGCDNPFHRPWPSSLDCVHRRG